MSDFSALFLNGVSIPTAGNFPNLAELDSALVAVEFNSPEFLGGRYIAIGAITDLSIATGLCNGLPVTVDLNLGQTPGPGDDVVMGTPGNDDIRGRAGNDTICGMGGNDFIHGNSGDDWIDGGDGVCLLYTSPSPRDATLSRMPSSA